MTILNLFANYNWVVPTLIVFLMIAIISYIINLISGIAKDNKKLGATIQYGNILHPAIWFKNMGRQCDLPSNLDKGFVVPGLDYYSIMENVKILKGNNTKNSKV